MSPPIVETGYLFALVAVDQLSDIVAHGLPYIAPYTPQRHVHQVYSSRHGPMMAYWWPASNQPSSKTFVLAIIRFRPDGLKVERIDMGNDRWNLQCGEYLLKEAVPAERIDLTNLSVRVGHLPFLGNPP